MTKLKQRMPMPDIMHALKIMDSLRVKMLYAQNFKQHVELSEVYVDPRNNKIYLPGFSNIEIKLRPLEKALYFLFRRYPNGLFLSDLPDHRDELSDIYEQISHTGTRTEMRDRINDLVNVLSNSASEKISRIKRAFEEARARKSNGQGTLLFVDEIHRFNRAQQDGFLPVVEDGTVTLVGATTENPSFALNGALLSRCQVLVLKRLDDAALELLLTRAEALMGRALPLAPEARAVLRAMADGDGRYGLNMAEQLFALPEGSAPLDPAGLSSLLAKRAALYDKDREEHYNLISALHKSMRGSDPDAALYWFARMLTGGEDPRYIARRLTRFAAEDIGMADPRALPLAIAAWGRALTWQNFSEGLMGATFTACPDKGKRSPVWLGSLAK